jgi:hypothetical protein
MNERELERITRDNPRVNRKDAKVLDPYQPGCRSCAKAVDARGTCHVSAADIRKVPGALNERNCPVTVRPMSPRECKRMFVITAASNPAE